VKNPAKRSVKNPPNFATSGGGVEQAVGIDAGRAALAQYLDLFRPSLSRRQGVRRSLRHRLADMWA